MTRSGNRQQQLTAQAGQSDMDLLVEEYSTLTKKKKKKKIETDSDQVSWFNYRGEENMLNNTMGMQSPN